MQATKLPLFPLDNGETGEYTPSCKLIDKSINDERADMAKGEKNRAKEEKNKLIRDKQREKILKASMKVFARKGLAETKMADIAAAADVSYGLAYHYFANKEAILTALIERAMQGAARVAQEALERPGTPWERLRWLTVETLEGLRDQPEYFWAVLQVFTNEAAPQRLREMVHEQSRVSWNALRQLIIEGQAAGQVIAGDPDQLAALYDSCTAGIAVNILFHSETEPMRAFPTVDQVLRILKA
jgi:AcrR family transcriptional regulator